MQKKHRYFSIFILLGIIIFSFIISQSDFYQFSFKRIIYGASFLEENVDNILISDHSANTIIRALWSKNISLGVIVYLASPRTATLRCNGEVPRKTLLLNSILSVQKNWFAISGNSYPIIIFHEDWELEDREFIINNTKIPSVKFVKLNSFQTPETPLNVAQVEKWIRGKEEAVGGRDIGYRMMCRTWSGPIENHPELDGYFY